MSNSPHIVSLWVTVSIESAVKFEKFCQKQEEYKKKIFISNKKVAFYGFYLNSSSYLTSYLLVNTGKYR